MSGVDLYVQSDEEVLNVLKTACSSSGALCWVYKLLIYSGLRLSETCKLLKGQEDDKWIKANGFWKYLQHGIVEANKCSTAILSRSPRG